MDNSIQTKIGSTPKAKKKHNANELVEKIMEYLDNVELLTERLSITEAKQGKFSKHVNSFNTNQ